MLVTSEGDGAEMDTVAPVTVNGSVLVVPIGVVTVTVLEPSAAPAVIVQFALTVVEVEVMPVQLTPLPEKATAVAPLKLEPPRDTATIVPREPEPGVIEVSAGP